MKTMTTRALVLASIAALGAHASAQDGCVEGQDCFGEVDPVGPWIDGDPDGGPDVGDPGDPQGPVLRWSSFDAVTVDQDRVTVDHFGDSVVFRRWGSATAWGDTVAPADETFAADARLPGVEDATFYTLAARPDGAGDDYAMMLRFETGSFDRDDVLSIGQLWRNEPGVETSIRIEASYQGQSVGLSAFEFFGLDLVLPSQDKVFAENLIFDPALGLLSPDGLEGNSEYMMIRPHEGVLVDKLDIFVDSSRDGLPNPDRIDVALGSFLVPAPGAALIVGLGAALATRRRR